MRNGTLVYINERLEYFENGENKTRIRKIPGKVQGTREDGKVLVVHYGPPHHLTTNGKDFGLYQVAVDVVELTERTPNISDPRELI